MRRIKTWFRTSMHQSLQISLIHIKKEIKKKFKIKFLQNIFSTNFLKKTVDFIFNNKIQYYNIQKH